MKQIKFRAWQKYHKRMVEVTSISFDDNGEINGVTTFAENQTPQRVTYKDGLGDFFLTDERGMVLELMQSTGLKDLKGVEIFEGDVVWIIDEGEMDNGWGWFEEVKFRNGSFMAGDDFLINSHHRCVAHGNIHKWDV